MGISPAARPSPTAFTGLAVGPEAQGREALLSPLFGEAAGDTAPDSSPWLPGDRVAGGWDPTMAASGGRREGVKQLARTACPAPPHFASPLSCLPWWPDRAGQGWLQSLLETLSCPTQPLNASCSFSSILPLSNSPSANSPSLQSFLPLSLPSPLSSFIPSPVFFPLSSPPSFLSFPFPFLLSTFFFLSFFSLSLQESPLSCPLGLPHTFIAHAALWGTLLEAGGRAGSENPREMPGWKVTSASNLPRSLLLPVQRQWPGEGVAPCQPVAPALPQMGTKGSCSLDSNSMLVMKMSLKFN